MLTLNPKQKKEIQEAYLNSGFIGVLMICNVSADEFSLGKLDEDMTNEEYEDNGPSPENMLSEKERKINKENKLELNLEQRREIVQLIHAVFEKGLKSVESFEEIIEI